MNHQQKLDNIIFANRNKVYGAYVIRSEYASTLLKSLFSMMVFTGSIALVCFILTKRGVQPENKVLILKPEQTLLHTTTVDLSPRKTEVNRTTPTPNTSENKNYAISLIIKDSVYFSKDTTQHVLQENNTNNDSVGVGTDAGKEKTGDGKADVKGHGLKSDTTVALVADEFPEFEGGMAALNRWIASRLRYPSDAIEHTKQGKVHVKFIVDEQGKVQFPVAMNTLGYGLEEEALRVVSGIPNFKSPAKIAGQAVKCYFVLPVNFKLY